MSSRSESPASAKRKFDYSLNFDRIDFRKHPELYRVGKGEQGVLLVEPYKSEILPHWRFRTPRDAKRSSEIIYRMFVTYVRRADLPGADMARKFLQMGWTRARRYANRRSGRKYDASTRMTLPRNEDPEKAASAAIFYKRYVQARENRRYQKLKAAHQEKYG